MRYFCAALLLAASILAGAERAAAHDIPSDITVHMFVKPAGQRLQLLVRLPLRAIRDVPFPDRGQGYLDVEKLAPQLPDAAQLWMAGFISIYEGETRLAKPRVAAI